MIISNYGQERPLNCTDEEREIYDIIRSLCDDYNLESDHIKLMRKSDSYVSVVMPSSQGYGDMDLARVKFTDRARWIKIGPEFKKVSIADPEDVAGMVDAICEAYKFNQPYL